jgi:hypothetical protein
MNDGSSFYDAFSLTTQYSVDDRLTSEWWWIDEGKVHALSGIWTHGLSVQAIKPYTSDRAANVIGLWSLKRVEYDFLIKTELSFQRVTVKIFKKSYGYNFYVCTHIYLYVHICM